MSNVRTVGPLLIIQHTGQALPLGRGPVTIGRGEDNILVLEDPQVAAHHATISWQAKANTYIISDLGSVEGTYVNELRVEGAQPLRHGDVIRVGNTILDARLEALADTTGPAGTPPPPLPPEEGWGGMSPVLFGIIIAVLVGITLICAVALAMLVFGGGAGAPDVVIQAPPGNAQITAGNEIILKATASGAKDITLLELSVDGALVATATNSAPEGQSSLTVTKPWVFYTPGEHEISAVAYTAGGKSSRPESIGVSVVEIGGVRPTSTPTPESLEPEITATPTETPTLTPTPQLGAPEIEYFRANPQSINAGECTTLEWGQVSNADEARIEPDVGGVGTPGSAQVCPAETTTYVLTAEGPGGITTASTTIGVAQALADLTVHSINLVPNPPVEGGDTEVQITIRNVGAGRAGPFNWDWQPGSEPALSGRVDGGLNPNDQVVVTAMWRPASAYESLRTVARVDTNGEVAETDKGNNQVVAAIQVVPAIGSGTISPTSDPALDGYRGSNGTGSNRQDVLVGNGEMTPQGDLVWRGLMSFDVSQIPAGASVQNVELRFFQAKVGGDPYSKLGNLIIEHVVYGNRLTPDAFNVPPLASAVLPQQTAAGSWYILSDPTLNDWVQNDLDAGRVSFQVRLRFMQETDGDGEEDYVGIESGNNYFGTGNVPQLIVTYGP